MFGVMNVTDDYARFRIFDILISKRHALDDLVQCAELSDFAGLSFAAALGHSYVDLDLHPFRKGNEAAED